MSAKFFCDGCGKEVGHNHVITVNASTKSVSIVTFDGHLCAPCEAHLKEVADPRRWPRAAE